MTAVPQLNLLGRFTVQQPPTSPSKPALRRKTRALLAYLAVTDAAHTRRHLIAMFCSEANDPARVLALLLSRIRRHLGTAVILTEADTVQIDSPALELDARQFEQTLTGNMGKQSTETLETAVSLYRGEFLEGLTLPDAPQFELWLLGERARLQHLYEKGLAEIINRLIKAGQYQSALEQARRRVENNPLAEEAQAQLIWLYARTGQREVALRQFEKCRTLLQAELAVDPMPELQALEVEIREGRVGRAPLLLTSQAPLTEHQTETAVFVGRSDQLSQLQAAWQAIRAGQSAIILIDAPAGGGKTRLVHEFAQTQPQARLLTGRGYESSQATPYQPWVQLLESCLSELGNAAVDALTPYQRAEFARLLPSLTLDHPVVPASGRQEQLFHAVAQFLLDDESDQLIFLDDLQWVDEASLNLFHFLAQRLVQNKQTAVLLLGAWRSEEAEDNSALLTLLNDLQRSSRIYRLSLPPLNGDDTETLIAQLWPELPPGYRIPHLRDRFLQATQGNPLFMIEMVRELAGADELPASLPVPPSLQALIQRRLRRFPVNGRQVIEALAVLEQPGAFDLIRQISGRSEEETVNALELGLRWQLLQDSLQGSDHYDFLHDLLRTAVICQLSSARRLLLHKRAAANLEQTGAAPATLAYHWGMAGNREKECHFAFLAGEQAAAQFASAEAILHLSRALELLPEADAARRYKALTMREGAYDLQGRREEQLRDLLALEALAEASADKQQRAEAALRRANYERVINNFHASISAADKAVSLAKSIGDAALQAKGHLQSGVSFWRLGQNEPALSHLLKARTWSRTAGLQQEESQAELTLGAIYRLQGDYDRAIMHMEKALQIARQTDSPMAEANTLNNLGVIAHDQGNYPRAVAYYQQAIIQLEKIGEERNKALVLGNQSGTFLDQGLFDRATVNLTHAIQIFDEIDDIRSKSYQVADLSLIAHLQGDHISARKYAQEALALAGKAGDLPSQGNAQLKMGQAMFGLGEWVQAEQAFREALRLQRELGQLSVAMEAIAGLARVSLQQEELTVAVEHVKEIMTYLETNSLEGAYEPFRVYLTCYHVLRVYQDVRAGVILATAHELLQERAAWFTDEQERRNYLENVPVHHEIVSRFQDR